MQDSGREGRDFPANRFHDSRTIHVKIDVNEKFRGCRPCPLLGKVAAVLTFKRDLLRKIMKSDAKKAGPKTSKTSKPTAASKADASVQTSPESESSATRPAVTVAASAAPAAPASSVPSARTSIAAVAIPPILLEGDQPSPSSVGGPGERYVLGPAAPTPTGQTLESAELPEAYGTQRLLLTARDPHWLYAHWDLTQEQQKRYNARAVDRHLVLRIYQDEISGEPHREIHVHPESRNWFANVGQSGARYLAQLGYYRPSDQWVAISTSAITLTPTDTMSDDLSVWFATLPVDLQFDHLLRLIKSAAREHVPLLEALQQLRATGFPLLPDERAAATGQWTSEQERALSQIISMDAVRRVWMGSLEITELIRRQFLMEISSQASAQFSLPSSWSGALGSVTSPFGMSEKRKGFWFNVNAELIIYGATEPDATVSIAGRQIRLRADGTFSYRFALPDGKYDLPAVAVSNDGTDTRAADLKFSRGTAYHGEVGQHPQDPKLKPPLAAHVA